MSTQKIHLLVQTANSPGQPEEFIALCGHKGTLKRETSISLAKVTCDECVAMAPLRNRLRAEH